MWGLLIHQYMRENASVCAASNIRNCFYFYSTSFIYHSPYNGFDQKLRNFFRVVFNGYLKNDPPLQQSLSLFLARYT